MENTKSNFVYSLIFFKKFKMFRNQTLNYSSFFPKLITDSDTKNIIIYTHQKLWFSIMILDRKLSTKLVAICPKKTLQPISFIGSHFGGFMAVVSLQEVVSCLWVEYTILRNAQNPYPLTPWGAMGCNLISFKVKL